MFSQYGPNKLQAIGKRVEKLSVIGYYLDTHHGVTCPPPPPPLSMLYEIRNDASTLKGGGGGGGA